MSFDMFNLLITSSEGVFLIHSKSSIVSPILFNKFSLLETNLQYPFLESSLSKYHSIFSISF